MKRLGAGKQFQRSFPMNRLKSFFCELDTHLSFCLAEGGADRIAERMESLRDKAEATWCKLKKPLKDSAMYTWPSI
jgi:hypothetical protein